MIGKGTKVKCISIDDDQSRWGGNSMAKDFLSIGDVYTLSREPEVHSWHTKYYLEEFPNERFNSAQFKVV
jgi:hypothetical protein